MMTMPLAFLQNLGMPEMMVFGMIALLLFGNRLPSVMRSLGKSVTEFKAGMKEITDEPDPTLATEKKAPTTPEAR